MMDTPALPQRSLHACYQHRVGHDSPAAPVIHHFTMIGCPYRLMTVENTTAESGELTCPHSHASMSSIQRLVSMPSAYALKRCCIPSNMRMLAVSLCKWMCVQTVLSGRVASLNISQGPPQQAGHLRLRGMFRHLKDRWVWAQAQPAQASNLLPVRTKTALRKMPKVHKLFYLLSYR